MRPNTATGASSIAHLTTVMHTSCSEPNSSRMGLAWRGGMAMSAAPTMIEKTTICSISLCTMELSGFAGSRVSSLLGSSPKLGGPAAAAAPATAGGVAAVMPAPLTPSPGRMVSATARPMVVAMMVVTRK